MGEHQLFSQGLKELQDWLCEAQRVLNTCITSTTDKRTLDDRMLQLEVRVHDATRSFSEHVTINVL